MCDWKKKCTKKKKKKKKKKKWNNAILNITDKLKNKIQWNLQDPYIHIVTSLIKAGVYKTALQHLSQNALEKHEHLYIKKKQKKNRIYETLQSNKNGS